MIEVVFDFKEFKDKVELGKPLHHHAYRKCIDKKYGVFFEVEFRLQGVSRNGGHIVQWTAIRRTTLSDRDREQDQKWYDELCKKYADPLGSTEGEWRE